MFDAWSIAGVGGGSAVLTYLAAGRKQESGEHTFRLSLDKGGSLLGDVRLWGSALSWFVASYVKSDSTEKVLKTTSAAMLMSLAQTEVMRYRLKGESDVKVAPSLPLIPGNMGSWSYGGMDAQKAPAGRRFSAGSR